MSGTSCGSYEVWICNGAPLFPFEGKKRRMGLDVVVMKFGFRNKETFSPGRGNLRDQ